MAFLLPPGWWAQVLDGFTYEVDTRRALAFHGGVAAIRAAGYRQAEKRQIKVGVHKISTSVILLQGHTYMDHRGVIDTVNVREAPSTYIPDYEKLRQPCNCLQSTPGFHNVYCAWWRVYPEPGPLWPKGPSAYEQGLVAACTCGLGNDVNTGHPPSCAVWG